MNKIIIFIGLIVIFYVGRPIFAPILLATFIWYLINSIAVYYRKAMPWRKTWGAAAAAFLLSLATMGGLVYGFITQVRPMFEQLFAQMPEIQARLQNLLHYFGANFNPDLTKIAAEIGSSAVDMATTLGLVLVYIFFMFIEQSTFGKKLSALFPDKKKFKKTQFIFDSISNNMKKYMFMKTFVSALTAGLSYAWLSYLGLPFAGVWTFIIFIMNYIPTFGSMVACALPILYSLVSATSMHSPILVATGLIGLQIILGNILEPKLTGKTLNLSTLAILINLVFWGMLWGPVGMFFSVPLLVATFIITAQFDNTRWIAILLSADGNIPEKEDD